MARVRIIQWRDLPSLVEAIDGEHTVRVPLSQRFQDLIDANIIPRSRADNCANEYREISAAFNATIMTAVDKGLLEKVRATRWLRPQELQ